MLRPSNRSEMLTYFPKEAVIAELGVFRGGFSLEIKKICQPKRLYLVDTWNNTLDWYVGQELKRITGNEAYNTCLARMEGPNVRLRRQTTTEFLLSLPDNYLDAVYIDANHSYQSVRDELFLSYSRVKPGGWITGHDYCDIFPGVISAVDEFSARFDLPFACLTNEKEEPVFNCLNGPKVIAYNSYGFIKK